MRSDAKTVKDYLKEIPAEKRVQIEPVLTTVRENIPKGYAESMNWGMICWEIPLSLYPETYNNQPLMYAALAAQKNYNALYLMNIYSYPAFEEKLRKSFKEKGKKLNMGKSCIRFKKTDDLDLSTIGEIVGATSLEDYIIFYEKNRLKK